MEVGNYVEPSIAQWFQDQHPEYRVRITGTWVHEDRPWQLSNPDRLISLADDPMATPVAILECKYSRYGDGFGTPGTDEVPEHYACQTIWYSDVFGGLPVILAGLVDGRFAEWRIEYDEADALLMRDKAAADIIGPLSNDAITSTGDWQAASWQVDMQRRAECPWDATV